MTMVPQKHSKILFLADAEKGIESDEEVVRPELMR